MINIWENELDKQKALLQLMTKLAEAKASVREDTKLADMMKKFVNNTLIVYNYIQKCTKMKVK